MSDVAIRDAATIIVLRDRATTPAILMGQRGKSAVFMPGKFVFPGGAVDANDAQVPVTQIAPDTAAKLAEQSAITPNALAAAAVRELWEETGQIMGHKGAWPDPPRGWRGFAATGHIPDAGALDFFFRAVTPPGRPRRFDARFFVTDAERLAGDPDDFSGAEDELSHLQWVPLHDARKFDLAFITQIVLAELTASLNDPDYLRDVPFFRNDDEDLHVARLAGRSVL